MHHGKTRGKQKTHKICKKRKFYEILGNFPKVGGNKNLLKQRKFGRMEIEKCFWEKVNLGKFSTEADTFFGNSEGHLKQGKLHHCLRGDGHPCLGYTRPTNSYNFYFLKMSKIF